MNPERLFTAEEANAELPELRRRLPVIREARGALIAASKRIEDAAASNGHDPAGSEAAEAKEVLREHVTWLADRGILLRDPETGLVDFPTEREGRRVFLCWRLDEPDVAWFHDEHSGFSGRRPL